MFSVFIRLALTSALAALFAGFATSWQHYRGEYGYLPNFALSCGMAMLIGLAVAIWTYRTIAFGIALRAVLSVPIAGFAVFIVVWVEPFHNMPLSGIAFFGTMILACVLLIAAMWSYWPKKP